MRLRKDLTGKTFGRLTVLSVSERTENGTIWRCRCSCGKEARVYSFTLLGGRQVSCGCFRDELSSTRSTTHGHSSSGRRSPEYIIWSSMKDRCFNKKNKHYKNYGERGITVCPHWRAYENFLADMGPRPSPDLTIERTDNNGPYAPWNCRWASRQQQQSNLRTNKFYAFNGKTQHLSAWAREFGLTTGCLSQRLRSG